MAYGCKDREKAARKADEIRKSTDDFGIRQSICRFSCFGWLPSACHAEREYGYFLFSHRLIKGSEMEYIFSFLVMRSYLNMDELPKLNYLKKIISCLPLRD